MRTDHALYLASGLFASGAGLILVCLVALLRSAIRASRRG